MLSTQNPIRSYPSWFMLFRSDNVSPIRCILYINERLCLTDTYVANHQTHIRTSTVAQEIERESNEFYSVLYYQ